PGRCDSLLAVFSLGALLAWIRFDDKGTRAAFALHQALFGAALFSKETAIALPFISLAHSLFVTRRAPRARIALALAGWALVAVAWFFARRSAVGATDTTELVKTAVRNLPALAVGIGKLLIPV